MLTRPTYIYICNITLGTRKGAGRSQSPRLYSLRPYPIPYPTLPHSTLVQSSLVSLVYSYSTLLHFLPLYSTSFFSTPLSSALLKATDFYNPEKMKQAEGMVDLLKIVIGISKHASADLLLDMLQLLSAGCSFNLALHNYQEGAKDAAERIARDPETVNLFSICKHREQTCKLRAKVASALQELSPEGLPETIKEITDPAMLPFKLELRTTWATDSEVITDDIELVAAKHSQRLCDGKHKLHQLCQEFIREDSLWHAALKEDADVKAVLARGRSSARIITCGPRVRCRLHL